MPFTEAFMLARERWAEKGSPPCDHPSQYRDRWYYHVGAQWEGDYGCTQCGEAIDDD